MKYIQPFLRLCSTNATSCGMLMDGPNFAFSVCFVAPHHILYLMLCYLVYKLFLSFKIRMAIQNQIFLLKNYFVLFYFYFWLLWVFVAVRGLSLIAASGGYSSLWCTGFSLQWLLLWSTGSRCTGFSSCGTRAQQLWLMGSRVRAWQLWHTGLIAPRHVGSSQATAQTRVPCTGRRILNHCATRDVPDMSSFRQLQHRKTHVYFPLSFMSFKKIFKIIIISFVILYILFKNKIWHLFYSLNHISNKYLDRCLHMGFHCSLPIFYILVSLLSFTYCDFY